MHPSRVSQQTGPARFEFGCRCPAAAGADSGFLRMLRLAFGRAWPLDVDPAGANISGWDAGGSGEVFGGPKPDRRRPETRKRISSVEGAGEFRAALWNVVAASICG